jgi:hypothetical protein
MGVCNCKAELSAYAYFGARKFVEFYIPRSTIPDEIEMKKK